MTGAIPRSKRCAQPSDERPGGGNHKSEPSENIVGKQGEVNTCLRNLYRSRRTKRVKVGAVVPAPLTAALDTKTAQSTGRTTSSSPLHKEDYRAAN